jgi:hypothetical protein
MFDTLGMSLTVLQLQQLAPWGPRSASVVSRSPTRSAARLSRSPFTSAKRQRAGLDRADLFRRAACSASEPTTALSIARARGYITAADHAAVDAAPDRVRAMLWRLTL